MTKFKIGDKVRCVNADGRNSKFELNQIYTARNATHEPRDLLKVKELDEGWAMFAYRFELVKEVQPVFEPTLLNGRPISQLVCDGRKVLIRDYKGSIFVSPAHSHLLNPIMYHEWAEILKPEPKQDENGWWRFDEKTPELDECIQMAVVNDHYQSGFQLMTVNYTSSTNKTGNFTHWKPFKGPVV